MPELARHVYHGVPVGRNIAPIAGGRVHHYVGAGATVKGIAVPLLTAAHLWATFQKEAEDLIKVNGQFIRDDAQRNRRINAAYASLWLADNRFQWRGWRRSRRSRWGAGCCMRGGSRSAMGTSCGRWCTGQAAARKRRG